MSGRRRSRGPPRGTFHHGRAPHSKEAGHRCQTRRDTALGALSKPRQRGAMKIPTQVLPATWLCRVRLTGTIGTPILAPLLHPWSLIYFVYQYHV